MYCLLREAGALTGEELGLLLCYLLDDPCCMPAYRVGAFMEKMQQLGEHSGIGHGFVGEGKGGGFVGARGEHWGGMKKN